MDPKYRLVIMIVIVTMFQILLCSTIIYFIRRRNGVTPPWSWWMCCGVFVLLVAVVTATQFIPVIGPILAVFVTLLSLKRMTGLSMLGTVMLAFCLGLAVFAFEMHLDLYGLRK